MAKYSKEFIEFKDWDFTPDFSISDEFKKLKPGQSIPIICEGFGFNAILNEDDTCYLVFHFPLKRFTFGELISNL